MSETITPQVEEAKVPSVQTGMGTAALVMGILSLCFVWFPFYNLIFIILAIVFGSIAKGRGDKNGKKGMVMGIVAAVIIVATMLIFFLEYLDKQKVRESNEKAIELYNKLAEPN